MQRHPFIRYTLLSHWQLTCPPPHPHPPSLSFSFIFPFSHFFLCLTVLLSSHSSLFVSLVLRQTGSVRSDQVISGLIGRLMFLQKPGTLTCLSSSLMHFLPKSQTCWRLAEIQTPILFFWGLFSANQRQGWHWSNDTVRRSLSKKKMTACTNHLYLPWFHCTGLPYYWGYRYAERKSVSLSGLEE